MSKVFIEESTLTAIGEAIREKTGGTELIPPLDMATAIESIETGGGGFWDEDTVRNFLGGGRFTPIFPDGLTKIGEHKFYSCVLSLENDTLSIPEGITHISNSAFRYCLGFRTLILPTTLESLGDYVFGGSTSLNSVTFKSSPTGLTGRTFWDGDYITDIYVPWAETDEINEYAPWGATNATIHYNYITDEDVTYDSEESALTVSERITTYNVETNNLEIENSTYDKSTGNLTIGG